MIRNNYTKKIAILNALLFAAVITACAQNVGIATSTPQSKLDIKGNMIIGSSYAGASGVTAPTNGAIIQGQVRIGTQSGTAYSAPNASAILDLSNSATNLGLIIPGMPTSSLPSTLPAAALGLTVFNTTTGCLVVNLSSTTTASWVPACQ